MLDSIKKAFVLMPKALKLFYVLTGIAVVMNLINLLVIPAPVDTEMSLGRSFAVIGLTAVFAVIGLFIYGGALAYIKELIKSGSGNIASFLDNSKKYFLRILGITALVFLIFLILSVLSVIIVGVMPNVIKVIISIIMVLAFITLSILFVMPGYAAVGSDLGVVESIRKGVLVGKKNFLAILLMMLIIFAIAIAVIGVTSLITGLTALISRPLSGFVSALLMAAANSAMTILIGTAFMDLYFKKSE